MALDSKGDVWAWGSNTDGQLGLAHTDPQPVPIRVPKLQGLGIAQISAGSNEKCFRGQINLTNFLTLGLRSYYKIDLFVASMKWIAGIKQKQYVEIFLWKTP